MVGQTHKLLDAVTVDGDSVVQNVQRQGVKGLFQVEITGTAGTVTLYGRADADAPWVEIAELTEASDPLAVAIELFPQVKATLSGVSSATVSAWVVE